MDWLRLRHLYRRGDKLTETVSLRYRHRWGQTWDSGLRSHLRVGPFATALELMTQRGFIPRAQGAAKEQKLIRL